MFELKLSTLFGLLSNVIPDDALPLYAPGVAVYVDAIPANSSSIEPVQQGGIIQHIGISPYYAEERDGIQRAYVIGETWSDYVLLDDLLLVSESCTCCDCGKEYRETMMCPECGYCLGCCDCVTEDSDEMIQIEDMGEDVAYDNYKDDRAVMRCEQ